jgi:hypothetical protein
LARWLTQWPFTSSAEDAAPAAAPSRRPPANPDRALQEQERARPAATAKADPAPARTTADSPVAGAPPAGGRIDPGGPPTASAAAPDAARKAVPAVRTDDTEPPSFEALSSWSRLTISRRGGESRSLSRPEARELNALLGGAALSAVGPRPLGGTPEWRVTLERGGEVQAVLEIAGSQVRWREGRMPPATGVPSAPALAALRAALQSAVQPPTAAGTP